MDDKSNDAEPSETPMVATGTKNDELNATGEERTGGLHARILQKNEPMREGEIREAIKIHSAGVVKEIYDTVVRQMQYEQGRQGRLDAKANSLLAANGLSLTILFTFGVQVLSKVSKDYASFLVILLWLTVAMGLASGIFAAVALLVREYRMVNERDLFDANVLSTIDNHSVEELDSNDNEQARVSILKRHHIPQMWSIVQMQVRIHQKKAQYIERGQYFFLAFLVGIAVIALATSAILRITGQTP